MELVDSIHSQNAPPHRAEMGDESAKSKGKSPNPTKFTSLLGENSRFPPKFVERGLVRQRDRQLGDTGT